MAVSYILTFQIDHLLLLIWIKQLILIFHRLAHVSMKKLHVENSPTASFHSISQSINSLPIKRKYWFCLIKAQNFEFGVQRLSKFYLRMLSESPFQRANPFYIHCTSGGPGYLAPNAPLICALRHKPLLYGHGKDPVNHFITEKIEFLKMRSPFAGADMSTATTKGTLDLKLEEMEYSMLPNLERTPAGKDLEKPIIKMENPYLKKSFLGSVTSAMTPSRSGSEISYSKKIGPSPSQNIFNTSSQSARPTTPRTPSPPPMSRPTAFPAIPSTNTSPSANFWQSQAAAGLPNAIYRDMQDQMNQRATQAAFGSISTVQPGGGGSNFSSFNPYGAIAQLINQTNSMPPGFQSAFLSGITEQMKEMEQSNLRQQQHQSQAEYNTAKATLQRRIFEAQSAQIQKAAMRQNAQRQYGLMQNVIDRLLAAGQNDVIQKSKQRQQAQAQYAIIKQALNRLQAQKQHAVVEQAMQRVNADAEYQIINNALKRLNAQKQFGLIENAVEREAAEKEHELIQASIERLMAQREYELIKAAVDRKRAENQANLIQGAEGRGQAKDEYDLIKGKVDRDRQKKEAELIKKGMGRQNVRDEVDLIQQAVDRQRRGQQNNFMSNIRQAQEFGHIPGQSGLNDPRMNNLISNLVNLTLDESSKPKIITNRAPVEAYMGRLIAQGFDRAQQADRNATDNFNHPLTMLKQMQKAIANRPEDTIDVQGRTYYRIPMSDPQGL